LQRLDLDAAGVESKSAVADIGDVCPDADETVERAEKRNKLA